MPNLWLGCWATGVAMATMLYRTLWGIVFVLAPEYEFDVTTQIGFMAYLPVYILCPSDLERWPVYTKIEDSMVLILKFIDLCIFVLFVISLGGLQQVSICGFDYFETCGVVDKSPSSSRWAIIAEVYSVISRSEYYVFKKWSLF